MLSLLFRTLHTSVGGYSGTSSSTRERSTAKPDAGGVAAAAPVPAAPAGAAPATAALSRLGTRAAPPAEECASLRAAATTAGSRRFASSYSRSSGSSSSCSCSRASTRSATLLPSLRPVLRAPSVALCDEGRMNSSSSFFSSFKFFGRQRSPGEGDASATAGAAYPGAPESCSQEPGTALPTASSVDTFTTGEMAVVKPSALGAVRSHVGEATPAAAAHPGDSGGAAAGAPPPKHTRPPSTIPIPYEQFSREWMGVSGQDNFDGFRLEATKQVGVLLDCVTVNKILTANHTFHLGTTTKEGGCSYSFGPTLVIGEPDEAAQQEGEMPKFFGMARLSSDGFLQARFIKALGKTSDIKFNSNSSLSEGAKEKAMYEICVDKVGNDWATNLKLAWQGTWIVNGLFSQVITPKLQMGGELTWVTANGLSMASVGGRFAFDENNIGSCQIGVSPDFSSPLGLATDVYSGKAQYVRKVTDRLSVGTEIECAHPDMTSSLKLGWQYLFRQARVQGTIDTAGRVAMYSQDYNGFALSGLIDYWHGDYKFGFQMNVVPPPPAD